MRRLIRNSLIGLLTLTSAAQADRLIMQNGDHLTGTATHMAGDKLSFETSYGGELKIRWADVAELHTDAPVTVVLEDKRQIKTQQFTTTGADESVAISQVSYVNPPPAAGGEALVISGRVNVGLSQTAGNTTTETYHVDAETILRKQRDRLTLGLTYNEASDEGAQSVSNASLGAKYDHFISERWYAYANAKLRRDKFRDLKLRRDIGVGLGHQFYDQADLKLALEAGISHIGEDYFVAPDDSNASLRWAANYEQRFFGELLTLFHDHELTMPADDSSNFLANAKTGVRVPVANGLTTTFQVDADYDNIPSVGKDKTDLVYLFTLGYAW